MEWRAEAAVVARATQYAAGLPVGARTGSAGPYVPAQSARTGACSSTWNPPWGSGRW